MEVVPFAVQNRMKIIKMDFKKLFKPKSIAIIGASSLPGKIGYSVVNNLIEGGYRGEIFPVNLKETSILGIKAYKSVLDIPEYEIDLAILAIPARFCVNAVSECGKRGIKFVVVISAGFAEAGNLALEEELVIMAGKYGMRIVGPNVVGILSNPSKCNASFAPCLPYAGEIALISQSGAMIVAIDAKSWVESIGISYLVSIGNMADIQIDEVIDYLNTDPDVGTISIYVEGLKDGLAFMKAAERCTKPIIVLKAGISTRGAAAAASHTGSLAGSNEMFDAAMKQCGVVKAGSLNALFSRSKALAVQPPLRGNNLLVITNGGGAGVLTADASELNGIPLNEATKTLQQDMQEYFPPFGSSENPIDLTGMATASTYHDAMKTALLHDWVDGVIVLYSITATTAPMAMAEAIVRGIRDSEVTDKPVVAGFLGGAECGRAITSLIENRVPAYDGIEVAVNAMAALRELAQAGASKNLNYSPYIDVNRDKVREKLNGVKAEGRKELNELESKEILFAYGLPVVETFLAKDTSEAVSLANSIGYPVVMKISSSQILHKTDAGGVRVGVKNKREVREIYNLLVNNARKYNAKAIAQGITVQRMAKAGTEVIIGSVRDRAFGPVVMFGLGGIFVELLRDVVFRVAPISKERAIEMIRETRSYPMFEGLRGQVPKDINAIAENISRLSQLVYDFDEIKEVDANPVFIYEQQQGCMVVDARIILK